MGFETRQSERFFVKPESAFGDTSYTTFADTDTVLLEAMTFQKKLNRTVSGQRNGTPDELVSQDARHTATWTANGLWGPSGTLGTPSDYKELWLALMGSYHSAALSTTIASAPATTGAVLTSATGLQVGDVVIVEMPDGSWEPTRIKSIATATVTWDTLSGAPDSGADVKSCPTYRLTTAKPQSLALGIHETVEDIEEALSGAFIQQATITLLDAGKPSFSLSGEAKDYHTTGITTPSSGVTADAETSGLTGKVWSDGNAFTANQVAINFTQGAKGMNRGIGVSTLQSFIRNAKRQVRVTVDYYRDDERLRDLALAVTRSTLRIRIGSTAGKMVGAILPYVEYEIPDNTEDDGIRAASITGVAYGDVSGTHSNSSIYLFEA